MNQRRGLCPYVDDRDARCAHRLTLINLPVAFRLCVANHEACAVYHQMRLAALRSRTSLPVAQSA